ncbi:hypothetical protein MKZ38_001317 [Zalerion maritima]|uniref:Uncharacterized protein n=1 Tax=Zalerion maritima TaxID=339359 RepID=A0AAD5RFL9_9PEZI|nr:hypothetical protein MKZ38_001317 [Zalerion maritima]
MVSLKGLCMHLLARAGEWDVGLVSPFATSSEATRYEGGTCGNNAELNAVFCCHVDGLFPAREDKIRRAARAIALRDVRVAEGHGDGVGAEEEEEQEEEQEGGGADADDDDDGEARANGDDNDKREEKNGGGRGGGGGGGEEEEEGEGEEGEGGVDSSLNLEPGMCRRIWCAGGARVEVCNFALETLHPTLWDVADHMRRTWHACQDISEGEEEAAGRGGRGGKYDYYAQGVGYVNTAYGLWTVAFEGDERCKG